MSKMTHGFFITINSMILYFKHIIHIDDFPLNGPPPSFYNKVHTAIHSVFDKNTHRLSHNQDLSSDYHLAEPFRDKRCIAPIVSLEITNNCVNGNVHSIVYALCMAISYRHRSISNAD